VKRSLLAIALSLPLLFNAVVHAQTTQLKMTMPFDFIAGDTALPAGDYDVHSIDARGGNALSIHGVTLNAGTLVLSTSSRSAKTPDRKHFGFLSLRPEIFHRRSVDHQHQYRSADAARSAPNGVG
jgi:hypothetical protein